MNKIRHRGPNELEERTLLLDSEGTKTKVIQMKNKFGCDCRLCPMPTEWCLKRKASFDAELFKKVLSKL